MTEFRFAVNVLPKPGILDPQGRAVEGSLGQLRVEGVSEVRVGRSKRPCPSSVRRAFTASESGAGWS